MATNAQLLLGSTFAFGETTVGEVLSGSGTFATRQKRAIVSCDSTNGMAENLQGTAEYGDLTIGCIYDPSASGAFDALATAVAAGTESAATFTYPDGTTVIGTGFISNLSIPGAGDPNSECDVTLTVTPTSAWAYTDLAA